MTNIGQRMRELRKEKNITQPELAKMLGVSNGAIGNWETGNRQPDDTAKIQMADIFGVSVDYLIGRTDNRQITTNNEDLKFALFGGAANITDDMVAEVRQFAEMVRLREKERKRKEQDNEHNGTNDL